MSTIIQMRKRGSITIPSKLRERYELDENDPITLVDIGEGIFLSPKRSVIPKLVGEIEYLREKYQVSLEELIKGIAEQRDE